MSKTPNTPISKRFHKELDIEEFIPESKNVLQDYICSLCNGVYFNPVLDPSGHIFCIECLNLSLNKIKICPQGGEPLLHANLNHFKFFEGILGKQIIYCKNKKLNCEWTGKFSDLSHHIKEECRKQILKCENEGCNEDIIREEIEEHKNICKFLKLIITEDLFLSPLATNKNKMKNLKLESKFTKTKCIYNKYGCYKIYGSKIELKKHLKDSLYYHNILTQNFLTNIKNEISEKVLNINKQKERIDEKIILMNNDIKNKEIINHNKDEKQVNILHSGLEINNNNESNLIKESLNIEDTRQIKDEINLNLNNVTNNYDNIITDLINIDNNINEIENEKENNYINIVDLITNIDDDFLNNKRNREDSVGNNSLNNIFINNSNNDSNEQLVYLDNQIENNIEFNFIKQSHRKESNIIPAINKPEIESVFNKNLTKFIRLVLSSHRGPKYELEIKKQLAARHNRKIINNKTIKDKKSITKDNKNILEFYSSEKKADKNSFINNNIEKNNKNSNFKTIFKVINNTQINLSQSNTIYNTNNNIITNTININDTNLTDSSESVKKSKISDKKNKINNKDNSMKNNLKNLKEGLKEIKENFKTIINKSDDENSDKERNNNENEKIDNKSNFITKINNNQKFIYTDMVNSNIISIKYKINFNKISGWVGVGLCSKNLLKDQLNTEIHDFLISQNKNDICIPDNTFLISLDGYLWNSNNIFENNKKLVNFPIIKNKDYLIINIETAAAEIVFNFNSNNSNYKYKLTDVKIYDKEITVVPCVILMKDRDEITLEQIN